VFCGGCTGGQWCQPGAAGTGIGVCGGSSPLVYPWQREKINMLVSMGENDNTTINYGGCGNIGDGRGYTIGQVGFCTGTGDFIVVARCYNDRKPNNVLSKYWNALVQINNAYWTTGTNQGSTAPLDAVGKFCTDLKTASAETDGIFDKCQDDVGDADYMAAGFAHAQQLGLEGVLTLGFLYDTELNFGEGDDPGGLGGTATILNRATTDYGMGMPSSFSGKTWEESRFLGFIIRERVVEMSGDRTWQSDMDQNATWEAARRLHTAKTNSPETGTDLSMTYDEVSAYKAGAGTGACWAKPPLVTTIDAQSTVFTVSLNKSASATDQTKWVATAKRGGSYTSCPANPTL
jgi:chitosanase